MRSRFSAYCTQDYCYILNTYASSSRQQLSVQELQDSAAGTRWVSLVVYDAPELQPHQVEFSAFYFDGRKFGKLHETSDFVLEQQQWRYASGELHQDCGVLNVGRNDPCPCNSGKKFKQCCLKKAG